MSKIVARKVSSSVGNVKGTEVPVNDTKTYDNGVKVVPSNLLVPYSVGKGDIEKLLIGSGYIKAEELQ